MFKKCLFSIIFVVIFYPRKFEYISLDSNLKRLSPETVAAFETRTCSQLFKIRASKNYRFLNLYCQMQVFQQPARKFCLHLVCAHCAAQRFNEDEETRTPQRTLSSAFKHTSKKNIAPQEHLSKITENKLLYQDCGPFFKVKKYWLISLQHLTKQSS
jgi:hypothetical protein